MSVDLAEHSLVLSKLFSQGLVLDISAMSMLVNKVRGLGPLGRQMEHHSTSLHD